MPGRQAEFVAEQLPRAAVAAADAARPATAHSSAAGSPKASGSGAAAAAGGQAYDAWRLVALLMHEWLQHAWGNALLLRKLRSDIAALHPPLQPQWQPGSRPACHAATPKASKLAAACAVLAAAGMLGVPGPEGGAAAGSAQGSEEEQQQQLVADATQSDAAAMWQAWEVVRASRVLPPGGRSADGAAEGVVASTLAPAVEPSMV
jgi:hypothetical protein